MCRDARGRARGREGVGIRGRRGSLADVIVWVTCMQLAEIAQRSRVPLRAPFFANRIRFSHISDGRAPYHTHLWSSPLPAPTHHSSPSITSALSAKPSAPPHIGIRCGSHACPPTTQPCIKVPLHRDLDHHRITSPRPLPLPSRPAAPVPLSAPCTRDLLMRSLSTPSPCAMRTPSPHAPCGLQRDSRNASLSLITR